MRDEMRSIGILSVLAGLFATTAVLTPGAALGDDQADAYFAKRVFAGAVSKPKGLAYDRKELAAMRHK
jgi:hypothetical protein